MQQHQEHMLAWSNSCQMTSVFVHLAQVVRQLCAQTAAPECILKGKFAQNMQPQLPPTDKASHIGHQCQRTVGSHMQQGTATALPEEQHQSGAGFAHSMLQESACTDGNRIAPSGHLSLHAIILAVCAGM